MLNLCYEMDHNIVINKEQLMNRRLSMIGNSLKIIIEKLVSIIERGTGAVIHLIDSFNTPLDVRRFIDDHIIHRSSSHV